MPTNTPTAQNATPATADPSPDARLVDESGWRAGNAGGAAARSPVSSADQPVAGAALAAIGDSLPPPLPQPGQERRGVLIEPMAQAFRDAAIGMALTSSQGRLLQVNRALAGLLNRSADHLIGLNLLAFVHPQDRAGAMTEWQRLVAGGLPADPLSLRLRLEHGEHRLVTLHSAHFQALGHAGAPSDGPPDPVNGRAGAARERRAPALMLQLQDVTERQAAEQQLQHVSLHDGLTSLANRVRFCACLSAAIARAQANPQCRFAVAYLDFDRFRQVNEALGHAAGDRFLSVAARRIAEAVRPFDVVGRMGGDEFAVLIEDVDETVVEQMARRLLQRLAEPLELEGTRFDGSASIGLTFSRHAYDSPGEVLRDADLAMERAKSEGPGQLACYDPVQRARLSERVGLEHALRRALADETLRVAYQPIADLATGQVHSVEALVRWDHPELGPVSPATFVPIAEATGTITALSRFVLERACRDLARFSRATPAGCSPHVHVNISGHDIGRNGFVEAVSEVLLRHGVAPHQLTLELTETTLMQRVEAGLAAMQRLRAIGVKLSVDDFGTGYSSLAYLATLPIDSLKIDRGFIHRLQGQGRDAEVVRAVAALGRALELQVIAEGIETPVQLQLLRDMGLRYGQGYLLSRPLDAAAALAMLRSRHLAPWPAAPTLGEELIIPTQPLGPTAQGD